MLESVGFRKVTLQCGYSSDDRTDAEAEWIFAAKH
jgi:hypothetical protein